MRLRASRVRRRRDLPILVNFPVRKHLLLELLDGELEIRDRHGCPAGQLPDLSLKFRDPLLGFHRQNGSPLLEGVTS